MKIIINNHSGLNDLGVIQEISRIMKKGFVVAGSRYKERSIYKECVIVCRKNAKSFTFDISRI
jgi:hypothetical protein